MDMGEHCTLQSCGVLTFLPVNCPYCRSRFCQSHFLPLQHECGAPGAAEADRTLSDTEIVKRLRRANERRKEVQLAGPGGEGTAMVVHDDDSDTTRLPCQRAGCKRFSLHLDSAATVTTPAVSVQDGRHAVKPPTTRSFTHAAPRCDRCRGFFCMTHRSAVAHKCTAPAPSTEGDQRRDAANERKRRAQEVLNKHFPNRKT